MDELFQDCVDLLNVWANALGMTYEEINIWIFVILEPIVFVAMCVWIVRLVGKNRKLVKALAAKQ